MGMGIGIGNRMGYGTKIMGGGNSDGGMFNGYSGGGGGGGCGSLIGLLFVGWDCVNAGDLQCVDGGVLQ